MGTTLMQQLIRLEILLKMPSIRSNPTPLVVILTQPLIRLEILPKMPSMRSKTNSLVSLIGLEISDKRKGVLKEPKPMITSEPTKPITSNQQLQNPQLPKTNQDPPTTSKANNCQNNFRSQSSKNKFRQQPKDPQLPKQLEIPNYSRAHIPN